MSPLNVEPHAIRAICNHFAGKSKYALDFEFARAIEHKLSGAEVRYGYAPGDDERELPHSWIRMDNKDYDVQLIAQRIRAVRSGAAVPPDRVLSAKYNRLGEPDSSQVDMQSSGMAQWFLPSCAACRGKKRAHTLCGGCVHAQKGDRLERRAKDWEAVKNTPLRFFAGGL
jgi:ribosomal protein L32